MVGEAAAGFGNSAFEAGALFASAGGEVLMRSLGRPHSVNEVAAAMMVTMSRAQGPLKECIQTPHNLSSTGSQAVPAEKQ